MTLTWLLFDVATPGFVYALMLLPIIVITAIVVGAVLLIVRLVRRRSDSLGGVAVRLDDDSLRGWRA